SILDNCSAGIGQSESTPISLRALAVAALLFEFTAATSFGIAARTASSVGKLCCSAFVAISARSPSPTGKLHRIAKAAFMAKKTPKRRAKLSPPWQSCSANSTTFSKAVTAASNFSGPDDLDSIKANFGDQTAFSRGHRLLYRREEGGAINIGL